jgi:kynurenine 3-monooxygenase
MTASGQSPLRVAIIGAGPGGLTLALALARRAGAPVRASVFERAEDHRAAATFNPDRSYTIDITGHGAKAARYVGAAARFDASLIAFLGVRVSKFRIVEHCAQPGWTGSRGDICRALQLELMEAAAGSASVELSFGTDATVVSAADGIVELSGPGASGPRRETFDLIVGCDGAGSSVRRALQKQLAGFEVASSELANHSTMLALDLAGAGAASGSLDPNWLHVLSPPPVMMVAGAICGPGGKGDPLWFCQVGRAGKHAFASVDEARALLVAAYPGIERLASVAAIEAFAQREALPTGKAKACSSLHGGRVALLGDSGAPFPPVGQGVNAAMEAATVLDACIGEHLLLRQERTAEAVEAALAAYTARWAPEAAAAAAIAHGLDLEKSVLVVAKEFLYIFIGASALSNAKDGRLSYVQALALQRRADVVLACTAAAVAVGVWRSLFS